ncbi:MAG: ribosome biogenesis GTPase Der [Gammaproteobacteria bacterium]|nr:MAG: ribosome biogenesis GTPase Der [Gammaproteobacteria bacterium]
MIPVIALVGRPNVGKSTLFNRLTHRRDALVANEPGLTRDRQYGNGSWYEHRFIVIDTGGIADTGSTAISRRTDRSGILDLVSQQALSAVEEADIVLFIVDGREGLNPLDRDIADTLRRKQVGAQLVVNKAEGLDHDIVMADFHELGLMEAVSISATHGEGVSALLEHVLAGFAPEPAEEEEADCPHVAIVGRPNVGKSTLVNALVGEDRVLVFDQPGTTRDSIRIPITRKDRDYILIDTAGVRRRGKINETLEKFSVVKTLQSIDEANVVILLIDGSEGVTDQDASLAGFVLERGRAVVIAVNKWDKVTKEDREDVESELDRRLQFLSFAQMHFISALKKQGIGNILRSVDRAFAAANKQLPTNVINRVLQRAVEKTPPQMVKGRRIKLKFAHQGRRNPPTIVIHGNQVDQVKRSYQRYLVKAFRKAFGLWGTPVRLDFQQSENPYQRRKGLKKHTQSARAGRRRRK